MSWNKQTKDKPLYGDLIWSKPENKINAGKLLIIGGNKFSFSSISNSFNIANDEGAGSIRLLLPLSLKRTLEKILPDCEFAPVNPSGSFSMLAYSDFIENAAWSDLVLFSGDLGKNSETAILVEKFLSNYTDPVVLAKESADIYIISLSTLIQREHTTIILNLSQLQKLSKNIDPSIIFKFNTTINEFAEELEKLSNKINITIVVFHLNYLWCLNKGKLSSTPLNSINDTWIVKIASKIAVWQMQNKNKIFEATTTALL